MGIDEEIQNIYYSIYNINNTLFNIDQSLFVALNDMNFGLGVFDEHVNFIVQQVNGIKLHVVDKTQKFPNQWVYLLIFLFFNILLLFLIGFLIFYVIKLYSTRQQRFDDYKLWYLKNVMKIKVRKESKKQDQDAYERNIFIDEDFDTPPPTYSEYAGPVDAYGKNIDEDYYQELSTLI